MLMTVDEIKEGLGITAGDSDDFIEAQEQIISETIEAYCGRKFLSATYTETFYAEDYREGMRDLKLFHYPIVSVASIEEGDEDHLLLTRIDKDRGILTYPEGFFLVDDKIEVTYTAGYAVLPGPIKSTILSLVGERYNRKKSGVELSFGSDVQSVSIPGTISIQFDYRLQSRDRSSAFGAILGSNLNVLDFYRSERKLVGRGSISYVG